MTDQLSPPEVFTTARLILRRIVEDDAPSIFERYASDPEVTRFLSWPTHESVDDAISYSTCAVKAWEESSEFVWIIERAGELLGGLSFGRRGHRAHLGFVLRRDAWNQGLMTEAASALVEWLDGEPLIRRIEALCALDNVASRRVLEKIGLIHEGILRAWMVFPNMDTEPRDVHIFGRVSGQA